MLKWWAVVLINDRFESNWGDYEKMENWCDDWSDVGFDDFIHSFTMVVWWGKVVSVIPPTPSLYSIGVYYGLLLSAIFGTLIGAVVGYLIDKYRG